MQLDPSGSGARWDGAAMVPFTVESAEDFCRGVVDPFGVLLIDARQHLVELPPAGPSCCVHLASNTSANRAAWGAATTLLDAIRKRLGGSPGYFY